MMWMGRGVAAGRGYRQLQLLDQTKPRLGNGAAASNSGSVLVLGLFFISKQQEAPNWELGRQGVRLDNDIPPD